MTKKDVNIKNIAQTGCLVHASNSGSAVSVKAAANRTLEKLHEKGYDQPNLSDVVKKTFKIKTL